MPLSALIWISVIYPLDPIPPQDLELLVTRSRAVLLFLTAGVFKSDFVLQELRTAVKAEIGVLLLRETDTK
jgi:hypothetical protein